MAPPQRASAPGSVLASTVLTAPHHGGCGAATKGALEVADPDVVWISVGSDNEVDHPWDRLLGLLELALCGVEWRSPLAQTLEHGAVQVVGDGVDVWLGTERGSPGNSLSHDPLSASLCQSLSHPRGSVERHLPNVVEPPSNLQRSGKRDE